MANLKTNYSFTEFIRNSLGIDLDIIKEDDCNYCQRQQEKLREILSNYEMKTLDFLSILVEELSKQTNIQWKYEIVKEKGIETIYLISDLLGAKIFFAKGYSNEENIENKNTFVENINVDNVLDNDFTPFIKRIVYDIYLNYININRVPIINTYTEVLQETLKNSLEGKLSTEEQIAELEKKIEILRQDAVATNISEEQFKDYINNFKKGEDYKKYSKYPTSSTMSNIEADIEKILKKDIGVSSLGLGKNNCWNLGGEWEPYADLDKIHVYINDTPPTEIYYVLSLYTEYLKNLVINFSDNHQIIARKYNFAAYGIENFKEINRVEYFGNEASKDVEFMVADEPTGEVKSITFSELQEVFKQITDFIEKIKTYDLTSPNHNKYAGEFYESFYCTYGDDVYFSEELQKHFMNNAFIEGEGSEWKKDAILGPCELILKLIALITKFVENVDKYNEKVAFDDNKFQFYDDVFKRYKKYLEYMKEIASIENNELHLFIASLQAQNNVIGMLEKLLANMPNDTLTDTEVNESLQSDDIMRRVRKRLDNPNECEQLSLY